MDIDCFVLRPELFGEVMRFDPDVAVNCLWAYDATPDALVACTHFVGINISVADELRRWGRFMSPGCYDWRGSNVSLLHPRTNCRIPTAHERRLLLQVMPPDEHGRPSMPGGSPFFDTLVAYQLAAYASGFRVHQVRRLAHRTEESLSDASGAPPVWQQDMSDEVVHVGGVSYYHRRFHSPALRGVYLAAEYTILSAVAPRLPDAYDQRRRWLSNELTHLGLKPDGAGRLVTQHLVTDRNLSPATAAKVLGAR